MAGDALNLDGIVVRGHRGDLHEVEVQTGSLRRIVLAKRAGRLVKNRINLIVGDRVRVAVSPFDPTRGRITYRLQGGEAQ